MGSHGLPLSVQAELCSTVLSEECNSRNRRLMIVLIGMPGSGKSTFCAKLKEMSGHPWVRICQDVIRGGKKGTRELCVRRARQALVEGKNILVDRCNMNEQQRWEFLGLAQELDVEAHAVVLDLSLNLCIQRAKERVAHEGGLQGARVGGIITRMFRDLKLPDLNEGFIQITICRTENDIEKALLWYKKLVSLDQPSLQSKDVGVAFVECSQRRNLFPCSGANVENIFDVTCKADARGTGHAIEWLGPLMHEEVPEKQSVDLCMNSNTSSSRSRMTLAFPSISTADFQFDHEKASTVMIDAITEFLSKEENSELKLMLVDLSADSDMLSRVGRLASELGLDQKGFSTYAGDITRLCSTGGLECEVLGNCANWRLKAGGGGVNMAIFTAAGKEFECATKECAKTISPGGTVVVDVPQSSPLLKSEKVTHVIHVLGPNMNPNRPHCLDGDYVKGCKLLRTAYTNLFESFSQLRKRKDATALKEKKVETDSNYRKHLSTSSREHQANPTNAFMILMQSAKREALRTCEGQSKLAKNASSMEESVGPTKNLAGFKIRKVDSAAIVKEEQGADSSSNSNGAYKTFKESARERQHLDNETEEAQYLRKKWDGWAQALRNIAFDPGQHVDSVLKITDEALIVKDKYPKAKKHILVVSRVKGLDSPSDLRREHVPLLQHMALLGQSQAIEFLREDSTLVFRLGYHLIPSMCQLHLHVISQDFNSPYLKKRHHWNSFNTAFFRDSAAIIFELEKYGILKNCTPKMGKMLLDLETRCHRCHSVQPHLSKLKEHVSCCRVPFPEEISQFFISSTILASKTLEL